MCIVMLRQQANHKKINDIEPTLDLSTPYNGQSAIANFTDHWLVTNWG
jgi:hypothetical protein